MLLTTTIEKKITETVSLDIDLPYYAREKSFLSNSTGLVAYYRINENGSITSCFTTDDYSHIATHVRSGTTYKRNLKQAIDGEKITADEFLAAMERARAFHESQMLSTVNG